MRCLAYFVLAFALSCANAQTLTTIDPASGNTIVEVITVDPQLGVPVTQTLNTVAATTAPAAAANPANTQANQGPVGQPQTTLPGQTTRQPTGLAVGTVMDYSAYTQLVGTNTVAAGTSGAVSWTVDRALWKGWLAALVSVAGGAWMVLL